MPKQIKYAIIAVIVSIIVGGLDLLMQFVSITKQDSELGSITGFLVGVLFTGVLLVLIAKRYNWARWVYIVLTSLGLLFVVPIFIAELSSDMIGAISTAIQAILQAAAIVLMIQKPVNLWFKDKNQAV